MNELLTFVGGLFVWKGDFRSKDAPKAAGFRWHGGGCKAGCPACAAGLGKVWWTGDVDKAAALAVHADDAARERMAGAVRDVEASSAADADIEVPTPEGLALLPYQRAGVAYAMGRKRTLLAEECGLGKTIEALGVVNVDPEVRSVLVVCPASLTLNWLYEARRWLVPGSRPAWSFHVVQPGKPPPPDASFVIVADSRVGGRASAGEASAPGAASSASTSAVSSRIFSSTRRASAQSKPTLPAFSCSFQLLGFAPDRHGTRPREKHWKSSRLFPLLPPEKFGSSRSAAPPLNHIRVDL